MDVIIERDRPVPMRDGTVLRADIFRPADAGRYPTLLQRTAYSKEAVRNPAPIDPIYAAGQGVVVVIQDVRGKFASEGGSWYMFRDEFDDGYDSVEWAAVQPFSNGRVGLYGISYMANTSWQAAIAAPPSLGAIAPTQAPIDYVEGWDWLTRNGILKWGLLLNWTLQSIAEGEIRKHSTSERELTAKLEQLAAVVDDTALFWKVPLVSVADTLQELVGPGRDAADPPLAFFRDVVCRGLPKSWQGMNLERTHRRVKVPALITAGWYDVILGHDLEHFARMRTDAATPEAREQTRMVIGPWAHGSASMLQTWTGELDFGRRATGASVDMGAGLGAMQVDWFKRKLGDSSTGAGDDGPRVHVLVQGVNRWREADDWPIPGSRTVPWHLREGGGLTEEAGATGEPYDTFIYDPRDPCPTRGGDLVKPPMYAPGPLDQRPILDRRDVLVYTSSVLDRDVEVIGPVTARLFVATSGVSTDWVVKLCDVYEDGRTMNVCDGIARVAGGGEVAECTVDMWGTGIVFRRGHRIRVLVTSSDFPRYERNPNTGQHPWEAVVFEPALQRVFHDAARPSSVLLPVCG